MIRAVDEKFMEYQTNKIVDAIKSLKEPSPELPDYIKTNLNYYIKVKLTEHGKEVHREYWEPICNELKLAYKEPEVDSDGYSSFQMYDFMNVFGKHMTNLLVCETDVLIQRSK